MLYYLDAFVCIFFFIDFCLRLARAPSRMAYMKWGWIDLIASIPVLWHLQAARIFRVILIFRLIRALRSINGVMGVMFRNRAEGMFFSVASMTVLLVVFGAIAILLVEGPAPQSPIETAGDALWWAFVTITTVGYGDYYPVTTAGRVIAVFLMIAGVGLFGSFAAYVSSLYVSEESEDDDRQHRASREMIRHLNHRVEELTEEVRGLRSELHHASVSERGRHHTADTGPSEVFPSEASRQPSSPPGE
ncbi:ion transporter [Kushneria sinocarnis]|uniref:potassium channel family protein n=1 Tax=Kushneria sinocarnis TaxID=595502 RepID=UPI00319E602E